MLWLTTSNMVPAMDSKFWMVTAETRPRRGFLLYPPGHELL